MIREDRGKEQGYVYIISLFETGVRVGKNATGPSVAVGGGHRVKS